MPANSKGRKSISNPKQFIDGRVYACQSCKNGHRVRNCAHGRVKPIAPTAQPGRPSSGSARMKCTCPKGCSCGTDCNCAKNCLCTQQMYLICLVSTDTPRTSSPQPPIWTNDAGETETLKRVWANSRGELLSDDEALRRQREKEQREHGKTGDSCRSIKDEIPKPAPAGGCRHRDAVRATEALAYTGIPVKHESSPAAETGLSKCTCGASCACTLCPEHPNNPATRQYNASTLNFMTSQNAYSYTPPTPQASCMGGQPRFYLARNKPTQQDFHNFFPGAMNGDYVMSYPVDQSSWSVQSPPIPFEPAPQIDVPFDPVIDWTGQDNMWETRLGDACVDQIEQYPPFDPTPLQVPPMNGYGHVSPAPVLYNTFDASFQQVPLHAGPSFSVPMSTISPPPEIASYQSFDIPPNINLGQQVSPPQTRSGSCCGGSKQYTPNDTDMFDVTLPNMPLSPIPLS